MSKTPILVRFAGLSGRIYAVTRYSEKPHPNAEGETLITAHEKYDITDDVMSAAGARLVWLNTHPEDGPR